VTHSHQHHCCTHEMCYQHYYMLTRECVGAAGTSAPSVEHCCALPRQHAQHGTATFTAAAAAAAAAATQAWLQHQSCIKSKRRPSCQPPSSAQCDAQCTSSVASEHCCQHSSRAMSPMQRHRAPTCQGPQAHLPPRAILELGASRGGRRLGGRGGACWLLGGGCGLVGLRRGGQPRPLLHLTSLLHALASIEPRHDAACNSGCTVDA
jgi:hypothetical protein